MTFSLLEKKIERVLNNLESANLSNKMKAQVLAEEIQGMVLVPTAEEPGQEEVV